LGAGGGQYGWACRDATQQKKNGHMRREKNEVGEGGQTTGKETQGRKRSPPKHYCWKEKG